jgi:signal transduction histidine kinase
MINRLEQILDVSAHPFAIFSAEGTLLYQNKVFETFNDVQIDEKNIQRSEFLSVLSFILKGSLKVETLTIQANNQHYELEFKRDESDDSIFIHGTNISSQKAIEKNSEAIGNHLDILVNNSDHCLLMEDEHRKILFVNQKFCDLFNIPATPEQMIGADCSQSAEQSKGFFKNSTQFVRRINEILQNRLAVEKEILETVTNKTLERNYVPIFINNTYRGHLWTYHDISIEIELKNGLEVQRNFFESILNNIPADIAVFDNKHTYLFVNKNGIKNQELREWMIGKKDEDYAIMKNKPISMAQQRREQFNEAIKTKKISTWEDEIKITDSESEYVLRNFYPMLNEKGKVELVIGYGIDITNRKKVEKQIIANLEKEKQLTESKSNFITTVSHEIRTPLSIISLSAEAMQMYSEQVPEKLQQKFAGKLKQIETEIDRLTDIISEVITIEKIESGAFSLIKSTVDLKDFLNTLVDRQSKIQEDGRIAEISFSGKSEPISADKMKLAIAIDNLLSNAFKYSPNKPAPIVAVKFNTGNLQIKVTDFGLGIPETHALKLFKIFERAENVAHIRGTGIGLFLVKQIIELHGGSIAYAPNPSGGSVFTINLPYK